MALEKTTYTLLDDMMGEGKDEDFYPRFTFTADNIEGAEEKAFGWARYQGLSVKEVKVREAQGEELDWNTHNEYVS